MRSHVRNNKRGRGNKGPDDEHYIGAQLEDMHSETYTRLHEPSRHGDNYRVSTSSTRQSYDPGRESSSSRNRRHLQEWRREDEAERHLYMEGDGYHRHSSGRDDHTMLDAREPESWPPSHYGSSRDDWPQRYDYTAYPPSSYAESSSRNAAIHPHDGRSVPMDHWREADRQMLPPGDRHLSRESPNWRQEQRRDKNSQQYHNDSGWDTHRRSRAWDEPPATWDEISREKDHRLTSERTWDPAPGWHPPAHSGHDLEDRYSRSRVSNTASTSTSGRNSYSYSNTNSKNNKRTSHKYKRDWRDDDGSLNNWQRRELPSVGTSKPPPRKKQRKSLSRSRTRSPVGSYRSRRSSWDRSRSRSQSPAPKRQRRGDTPPASHIRTPSDRGRSSNWIPNSRGLSPYSPKSSPPGHRTNDRARVVYPPVSRHNKGHSPDSPKGYSEDRGRPILRPNSRYAREVSSSPKGSPMSYSRRRRSISSRSSVSSERSLSRSPPGRVRAVHRLPPANSAVALSPTVAPCPTASTPRKSGNQKNGKAQKNGKHHNGDRRKSVLSIHASHPDSMPPPNIIPLRSPRASYSSVDDPPSMYPPPPPHTAPRLPEPKPEPSPTLPRFAPVRNAGFKPIGQASSSLRKFFPGDEDEVNPSPESPQTGRPFTRSTEDVQSVAHSAAKQGGRPPIHHERKVWPSPPLVASSPRHSPTPPRRIEQDEPRRCVDDAPVFVSAAEVRQPPDLHTHTSVTSQVKSSSATTENDVPETPSLQSQGELYNIISQVGEGTFGKVYKAQNTVSRVYVALKRIRMESEKDGFPVTAMREIKLLQSLQHSNVVRLYEMMVSTGSVYMVFEYMDHDLTGVLSQTQFTFTSAHLKSLCHQMLAGLAYLHHKGVIHRDIKGSNILVNNRGELKLGDFGLARFYQKRRRADYTNRVITLWYRPPELLFGATVYGPEVDMWSAGCIMLELFTKKPVFQGNDEIHQLDVIYKIFGTPTPERWAGVMDLPWFELVKPREVIPNRFRDLFQKWMSSAALDLAERLLAYNPLERATASQAMEAPYFTEEEPKAALPVGLATLEGEWHELETKRERAKKKRKENAATESQHM
ncbi:hypothetical protein C0995_011985 [Termitomyces sp. Mi166|nr:hypothetical protein C0995_011985 [Termitomyces sp. Mi166\